MSKRSVESSRNRLRKRIERLEEKQKRLIDKIVYSQLPERKQFFLTMRIKRISKRIEAYRNCIDNGYRQSRGGNGKRETDV